METYQMKMFFLILKEIHGILPVSFKNKISEKDFYRYIQDKRKELNGQFTTLKEVNENNFYSFNFEFFGFVYLNIVNYYYSINNTNDIKLKIEQKFKSYFNGRKYEV